MTDPLLGAGRVRDLMRESGIRPAKSLGQNFVVDPNTIRKMIEVAEIRPEDHVLEIGAGVGSLTVGVAARAGRVTAVEVDERLLAALRDALGTTDNTEIVRADATTFDYRNIGATKLVANLPYNIAAQIVLRALENGMSLRSVTVMTQREVGERLAATPGSKVYGATSVLVAYHARARVAGRVSRNAFFPVPNVDSVIVRLDRHSAARDIPWELFAPAVRAAFAQRRKTLRAALTSYAGSASAAEDLLHRAGIDPTERAERVDVEGFLRLAAARSARDE